MSEIRLNSSFGAFDLYRLPHRKRELLRAWDAADEYLLKTLKDESPCSDHPLICNDGFGALAVALHEYHPISWSDSWLAHQAMRENLDHNGLDQLAVTTLDSLHSPEEAISLVLMKVPKTLALMEEQLIRLKPLLNKSSRLIVAGMVRSMPPSVWKLLEKIIGPTQTSHAVKKAKLIHVTVDFGLSVPVNPYPVKWKLDGSDYTLLNHANVFSRDSLDIGTGFLIQNLPQTEGPGDIIDLGCGNGVLGLMAAIQNSEAVVHFVDESYMAIASARDNMKQLSFASGAPDFHVCDGLTEFADQSIDLILCNPPFHQSHSVGDTVALSMFRESARVLRSEGELWVVANRHLAYHKKLRHWFGSVELITSNRKFVILKASLPKPIQ